MFSTSPLLVLVVDDDEIVRSVLSRVLERGGYEVATLDSGFGLAEAVRRHRPHLVLLDITMPGLSGVHALQAMRSLDGYAGLDVPVVLHSGLPEPQLQQLAQECGAAGFLSKPQLPEEIVSAVERFARGAPA